MTLSAKGFVWSMGIHAMFVLVVAVLQVFSVPQSKLTVIDFTLSGNSAPSHAAPSLPYQAPSVAHEPRPTKTIQPTKVLERNVTPNRSEEKMESPPQVSPNGEEIPTSLAHATYGSGTSGSAMGAHQDRGSTVDLTPGTGTSGNPGNVGTGTQEQAKAAYLNKHFVFIRDKIIKNISYPNMARKMGWCGKVKIAFIVCENGGVIDVRVLESSGFHLLDRNAVDTVKNVAPFPHPPVRAEIRMAINYRLN